MPRGRGFGRRGSGFCRQYPLLPTGSIPTGLAYPWAYPWFPRGGYTGYYWR